MLWRICLLATVLAWTQGVRADALADLPGGWADLSPVPELDISGAETRARSAIRRARENVVTLLNKPAADRTQLGDAYGRLGAYYHVYNIRTGAEVCYANAMRLVPDEFRWAYLDAYLAHVSGRYAEGLERFARAREIDSGYAPMNIYEAEALLEFNRVNEAESKLRTVLDVTGLRARAAFRLGQIALQRRAFDEAIGLFEASLQAEPKGTAVYFPLAQAQRGAGDSEAARAALARRGAELPRIDDPFVDELESLDRGARPFYLAGLAAARQSNFAAAADAFAEGLEQDPDNLQARTSYARALYLSGRPVQARAELERVEAARPENAVASFFLGLMDNAAGDTVAARRRFETVLRVRPDHSGALYFTGLMDFGGGDYEGAARNLDAACAAEPGNVYAQVLSLVARHRQGVPATELIPEMHAAIDADPGQWLPRYALVRLLAAPPDPVARDVPMALDMAEELVSAQPHPAVYEALALAQAAAGDFAAAEKSLETAKSSYFFNGRFGDVSRLDRQIAQVQQQGLPAEAWPTDDPLLRVPVIGPEGPFREYPAPRAY